MQKRHNSIAKALELHRFSVFCIKPCVGGPAATQDE